MAKTKSDKAAKGGKIHSHSKDISSVKDGAVTKSSQTPKAKSQDIAKHVATKHDQASKKEKHGKKAKKEPTPEPSSSESDDEMTSASSASSGSDSEAEISKPNVKVNGAANGHTKVSKKADLNSSDSSEDESEEEPSSEEDSSDDETAPTTAKSGPASAAKAVVEGSSSEDDDSESDEEEKVKGPVDAKALNGALQSVAKPEASSDEQSGGNDSEGSDEDSEVSEESNEGSGSSGSSEDEKEKEQVSKKRKAEDVAASFAKKSKSESEGAENNASSNLFVGNLSWNVDEEWLKSEFEGFGELAGVRIITDRESGRSRGFGYVEYVNVADAVKAHQTMKESMIDNRKLNLDFSKPRNNDTNGGGFQDRARDRAKSFGDQESEPSDTLFLGGISFDATEDIVGEEFGNYGTILGVRLPTDAETGQLKGFGYVQFGSVDEAREAFSGLNGKAICGRPIRLDYAKPRASNGDSPRGGSRGRGGRGGGRGRGGFGDRGGRGGRGGGRGGSFRGGRGGSTNRGGFGDFSGKKMTF